MVFTAAGGIVDGDAVVRGGSFITGSGSETSTVLGSGSPASDESFASTSGAGSAVAAGSDSTVLPPQADAEKAIANKNPRRFADAMSLMSRQ
jgi:hypothetical protein